MNLCEIFKVVVVCMIVHIAVEQILYCRRYYIKSIVTEPQN